MSCLIVWHEPYIVISWKPQMDGSTLAPGLAPSKCVLNALKQNLIHLIKLSVQECLPETQSHKDKRANDSCYILT